MKALGPIPDVDDVTARLEWERRAGWAAAWRELSGHDSADAADPLGAAPARGVVEKAVLFRAAHEALRLVDVGDREQLRAAAEQAARRADELELQVAQLEYADHARSRFYLHNAATRDNAERAAAELRARGVDPEDTSDRVTAAEWLDAHQASQTVEDADRQIRDEYELHEPDQHAEAADSREQQAGDLAGDAMADEPAPDRAAVTPERADRGGRRRVPPRDDTAADVALAQQALAEIAAREQADAERAAHDTEETARAEELARWAEKDQGDHLSDETAVESDDGEPVLER